MAFERDNKPHKFRYFKDLRIPRFQDPLRKSKKKQHRAYNLESRPIPSEFDLVVFAHIRWNLVFQRPQHLMTRWAKERRVFYIEEPVAAEQSGVDIHKTDSGVTVVSPQIASNEADQVLAHHRLLEEVFLNFDIRQYLLWYLTPMALEFSKHLNPAMSIYDCMDELSGFAGAPQGLAKKEKELFASADLVFTGGLTLYEAKKEEHHNIHAFPSSIDFHHFEQARQPLPDPENQKQIPHPRIGFFGVIDERMDRELVDGLAAARPDFHFIFIGPVLKIDPATLPQRPNIHYLGRVDYKELPSYLSGWDVAILPFARNDATRFISPTKTPEYLAAGKPVVSTSIRDVERPYAELGLVHIADQVPEFLDALDRAFREIKNPNWIIQVDAHLALNSWDRTWQRMNQLLTSTFNEKIRKRASKKIPGGVALPGDQPDTGSLGSSEYV